MTHRPEPPIDSQVRFHFAQDQAQLANLTGRLLWVPQAEGDSWIVEVPGVISTRKVYIQRFVYMETLPNTEPPTPIKATPLSLREKIDLIKDIGTVHPSWGCSEDFIDGWNACRDLMNELLNHGEDRMIRMDRV